MPNHVTNRIEFEENFNEILEIVKSEKSDFDFNNFIKMPESLDIDASTYTEYAFLYAITSGFTIKLSQREIDNLKDVVYYNDKYIDRAKQHFLSLSGDELVKFAELSKLTLENYKTFGVLTWYNWAPVHWGTKWNAYDINIDYENETITFDTAWSDPKPILDLFIKNLKFSGRIKSFDEGGWFWYDRLYKYGVLIDDRYKIPQDYNKLCIELKGWDPDNCDD